MTAIVYLDQQVKQACPNAQGVSVGRWNDKTTWRVTPDTIPQAEKDAARAVFDTFNKAVFEASQIPVKTLEERVRALEEKGR